MSAPVETRTILVKLDRDATRAERATVARLLDADASRGLPAGWRAYRVPDGMTPTGARRRLRATRADLAVEADGPIRATVTPNDPDFGLLYALPLIQAPVAWDLAPQGSAIVVAVIDSGIDVSHPDLAAMIWANPGEVANGVDDDGNGLVDDGQGWDFFHNDATVSDDPAEDAHGTHVAGTIGAVRDNSIGVAGVAGNVRLMPVKFLGTVGGVSGVGSTSGAIAAITYARQKGARIINASWGGDQPSQALCDAVAAAVADGVLFVAAAGNDGADNDVVVSEPADCPSPGVVSVAATTSADALVGFSNVGPTTVDLGAPGAGIRSTLPGATYGAFSGTSMAAPHVSGAAAVVLGQAPALTPTELRSVLMAGGTPLPALTGTTVSGRRLNIVGAINQATDPASDVTPPMDFVPVAPADAALAAARPTFSWTEAVDLGSGVTRYRVLVDGAAVAETAAHTLGAQPPTDLAEGQHTWRVDAEDRAGNHRLSAPRTLVVDSAPPQPFALGTPVAGATLSARRPLFRWSEAVDPGTGIAGYRLVIDGNVGPTLPPETRSASPDLPLVDGAHTWEVRAIDRQGYERASEQRPFAVDGIAPAMFRLRAPIDSVRLRNRRPAFAWTPAKDTAGAVTYEVAIDGVSRVKALSGTAWRPRAALRFGRHVWTVIAVDAGGNTRKALRETFSIPKPRPRRTAKRR